MASSFPPREEAGVRELLLDMLETQWRTTDIPFLLWRLCNGQAGDSQIWLSFQNIGNLATSLLQELQAYRLRLAQGRHPKLQVPVAPGRSQVLH